MYKPKILLSSLMLGALTLPGIVGAQQHDSFVDAEWVRDNIDEPGIRILDVSSNPEHFEQGHIPNALPINRHLDLGDTSAEPPNKYPDKAQFEQLMSKLGITPETTVVVYDDNKSLYATRLTTIMEIYGHNPSKLKILDGGIRNWSMNEFTVATGSAEMPTATDYTANNADKDILISSEDIYRDVVLGARPDVMLLDTRPADEHNAEHIRSVRGGNIPDSINVTGANFMSDDDHRLRSLDEVQGLLEESGVAQDQDIYVYCHSGDRAAHVYWILTRELGYENVHVNDSGWKGWATRLNYPVDNEVWAWQAD